MSNENAAIKNNKNQNYGTNNDDIDEVERGGKDPNKVVEVKLGDKKVIVDGNNEDTMATIFGIYACGIVCGIVCAVIPL